jgi:hypothetical protein
VNAPSAYDPATVPAWARESTTRIAREQPESLPHWLEHVAEVETAKQRTAAYPPARLVPPQDPRDFLHLLAIQAWRALASGQPAPAPDPMFLEQEISDAFGGNSPVDQLSDDWLNAARERGITVDDQDGEILPDVLETISRVITAAFWSGLTTGHHAIAGSRYFIPRKLMPYCGSAAGGWGGGSR